MYNCTGKPRTGSSLKGPQQSSRFTKDRITQLLGRRRQTAGQATVGGGQGTTQRLSGVCAQAHTHPRHYMWRLPPRTHRMCDTGLGGTGSSRGQSSRVPEAQGRPRALEGLTSTRPPCGWALSTGPRPTAGPTVRFMGVLIWSPKSVVGPQAPPTHLDLRLHLHRSRPVSGLGDGCGENWV